MKKAQEWMDIFWEEFGSLKVEQIRLIQTEAIRWAANLSGDEAATVANAKSDELDPPEPKKPL